MNALLRITLPSGAILNIDLAPGRYSVGREEADVVVADPSVSATHAELVVEKNGAARYRDLDSSNGSFDDSGKRLSRQLALRPGDGVRLGQARLEVLRPKGGQTMLLNGPPPAHQAKAVKASTDERTTKNSACPSCGSEDIRRFSVIYEEGTSSGQSRSNVYDNMGNQLSSSHSSSTNLAQRCAPPALPSLGGCAMFLVVAVFLGGWVLLSLILGLPGWLGFIAAFMAGGVAIGVAKSVTGIETKYHQDVALWRKTWLCLRCGEACSDK